MKTYIHVILNQLGKHIIDCNIRKEIVYAIDRDMVYTYYEGNKIEIVSDFKTDDGRETIVNVPIIL